MRIIIMFDLPVTTSSQRKEYTKFRKFLIKSGFMMLQESVYCKLVMNAGSADQVMNNIRSHKPKSGFVLGLKITEKQFTKMEIIAGEMKTDVLNSTDRIVIL